MDGTGNESTITTIGEGPLLKTYGIFRTDGNTASNGERGS